MQQIKSYRHFLSHFLTLCLTSMLLVSCSVEKSKPVSSYKVAEAGSDAATISSDGKLALVSSLTEGIVLWNLNQQKPVYRWQQQSELQTALILDIAENNSHAVTADSNTVTLWNLSSGDAEDSWLFSTAKIRDVALSNDGQHILIGLNNAKVWLINRPNNYRVEFSQHLENINSVDISANGEYALTASNDYVAYYWQTADRHVVHRFTHPSRITSVKLSPSLKYAFTTDASTQSKVWLLENGSLKTQLLYPDKMHAITSARFSPDDHRLLTTAADRKLALWELRQGNLMQLWRITPKENVRPPSAIVYSAQFNSDQTIVTLSSNGFLEQWPVTTQ